MKLIEKLYSILTKKQKLKSIIFFVILLLSAAIDLIGLGLLIPIVIALINPKDLNSSIFVEYIYQFDRNLNYFETVFVLLIIILVFYLVKVFVSLLLVRQQGIYIYSAKKRMANELFKSYLNRPFSFYSNINSSELVRNILNETSSATLALRAFAQLFAELIIAICITAALFYIEPIGTMLIFLLMCLSIYIFQFFTRKKLLDFGILRQKSDRYKIQHIQQALKGIKDIIISRRRQVFLNEFERHNSTGASAERGQYIFSMMPRMYLELIVIFSLCSLFVSQMLLNTPTDEIANTMGLFALAVFRLTPSANRILISIQQLRYCYASIKVVIEELHFAKKHITDISLSELQSSDQRLELKKSIIFDTVSFQYPVSNTPVIRELNLEIKKGEFIGISGESGEGKSTLLNLFLGLIKPSKGIITIDGSELHKRTESWQNNIGYVGQEVHLLDDTILYNLTFNRSLDVNRSNRLQRVINLAQLDTVLKNLPDGLNTKVGESGAKLSGGQRQRVIIARALMHDPQIIILDEATNSLDHFTEVEVLEMLKSLTPKKTIIFVTHNRSISKYFSKHYELTKGKINRI